MSSAEQGVIQTARPESTQPAAARIVGLFPQLLGVGGVQEAGRLTAMALREIAARRGCSMEILSLNDPSGTNLIETDEQPLSFRGFGRAKVRFTLAAVSQARPAGGSGRSVLIAGHPYLAVPAQWARRAAASCKVIVMSHGIEVWEMLPSFRRNALAHADVVLAPSSYTAQKLADIQAISPAKIRRLAWPLSPSFLRFAAESANLPLPSAFPRGRVVLTVGRWSAAERYKGADDLIRSVAHLNRSGGDLHLVAVGGGDDLPRLQKLAADLGISDRVHFLEGLSRPQIAACYAHADIFALPSTGEGFGLVFIEAMAFAKPVIGASSGGTTDVVMDGFNGLLVSPNDAGELTRALDRLLGDQALRESLGQNGAETVRGKYRFESFRDEVERILLDCVP